MLCGLAVDSAEGRLATFAALCVSGDRSPLYWMQLHWQQLPAMNTGMAVGMLIGSLLAVPFSQIQRGAFREARCKLIQSLVCLPVHARGMSLGSLAHGIVGVGTSSASLMTAIMVIAMILGMTLGTILSAAIHRAVARLASRTPTLRGVAHNTDVRKPDVLPAYGLFTS